MPSGRSRTPSRASIAPEAILRADPDAPAAYAVVGDLLQAQGDPRGMLIALQAAIDAAPPAARAEAQLAELLWRTSHQPELAGPLAREPRGALVWRLGFAAELGTARLVGVRRALAHPVGCVVRTIVVGEIATAAELATLIDVARAGAPCLQRLAVGAARGLGTPPAAPFAVELVHVPAEFSGEWLANRTAVERRVAAMRWDAGRDPDRAWRTSTSWFADRFLFELVCAQTDDAWLAGELLPIYRAAVRATTLLPPARWLADLERLRPHASPGLASALGNYLEHHLDAAYDAPMIRDLPGLFWPLAVLWHPVLDRVLAAYAAGRLDREPPPASLQKRRQRLLGWLAARVDAPLLAEELAR